MFHAYPDEWDWLERYIAKNKRAPSKPAFKNHFPGFRLLAVDDVEHFCEEVRRAHIKHELTEVIQDAVNELSVGDEDSALRVLHSGTIRVSGVLSGMAGDSDIIQHYEDVYDEARRRMERVAASGMAGIPTGFTTLDERTGGPQPGDLWIVGARLGEAKTWTLVKMATAAAMAGMTVQYDALEQSRAQIGMRLHSFLAGSGKDLFKHSNLMQGKDFSLLAYKKFLRELKSNMTGRIHVSDTTRGKVSPLTIAAQIERNKPDVVLIDYLTLMQQSGDRDWRSIADLSGELKTVATAYGVPIIGAAQLNRQSGLGKDPGPEALAQGDSLGQDADVVIINKKLSRRCYVSKLAKNRNGRDGFRWYSHLEPDRGIFKEVTYDQMQDLKDEDADENDE